MKLLKHWRKYVEILSFYKYTINENHIMHGSWDMEHNRQNFLSFWTVFCSFTSLWIHKIKILKKIKKMPGDIITLDMCTILESLLYMVSEIWSVMDRIFCHFRLFFCPFTPLTTWKIKLLKKWKNTWSYYHFTHLYHKWQPYNVWFLRYGARRT